MIIANEVLTAKVQDENTPYLASRLRSLGVRLVRVVVIEDAIDAIAAEVRYAAERYTHVFTSGGIGPTHDDMTFAGVAAAFGVPIEPHDELVREILALPPGARRDSLLRLASVPRGSTLVHAPGLRFPVIRVRNVWVLPGVPSFFKQKLEAVAEQLRGPPIYAAAVYCTTPESEIVPIIDAVVEAHPDVEIGSYPDFGDADHRTRLTIDGSSDEAVAAAVASFVRTLPANSVLRVTG